MADNVFDLCSSDEEEEQGRKLPASNNHHAVIDLERPTNEPRVLQTAAQNFARASAEVVSILDNDEGDNDGNAADDDDDLDRKPAARRLPRKRGNNHQDIVDLISVSPPMASRNTPSTVAKRPRQNHSIADVVQVVAAPPQKPKTPLERVFEVFPDVERNHAEKVLRECNNNLDMVLSILAERSYPRSKHYVDTPSSTGGFVSGSVVVKRTKVQPKYDYMSASSFEPSSTYIEEAVAQLSYEFPFTRMDGMKALYREGKNHYSIVRNRILDVLKGVQGKNAASSTEDEEIKQFQRFKPVWASRWPTEGQRIAIGMNRCLTRKPQRRAAPSITDPILKDEIQYAQWQLDEWTLEMEERIKRQEARKRSERSGCGVECGCCFDQVPIEEMVACRQEGHLFCGDCIQSYANTAVFSNGSLGVVKATGKPSCELLCCDSSGCQSPFHEEHLQKALSVKTLQKYNELQFRASIEAAGLQEEICSCPKCGFSADLPPNLIVFQCPVEDCRFESCRKCGKEPHIPLRCDEVVQQKREDEGRLKVEEAMAEAKIRKCPKCKTPIIKSDGCNKMTCRCGAKMCYICQKQLGGQNPYSHFCQTPHCTHKTCKSCTLYSNAEEDDERAMREAGRAAAQSYRDEVKEKEGGDVNIDVDGIMNTGVAGRASGTVNASRRRRAIMAGAAAFIPPRQPRHAARRDAQPRHAAVEAGGRIREALRQHAEGRDVRMREQLAAAHTRRRPR